MLFGGIVKSLIGAALLEVADGWASRFSAHFLSGLASQSTDHEPT